MSDTTRRSPTDPPKRRRKAKRPEGQSSAERQQAFREYKTLVETGSVSQALVVAQTTEDSVEVFGHGLTLDATLLLLLLGAHATEFAISQQHHTRRETLEVLPGIGISNGGVARAPLVTIDADGRVVAAPGESIIACGVCGHPRFYVFHHTDTGRQSRLSCAHCGNELVRVQLYHKGGSA